MAMTPDEPDDALLARAARELSAREPEPRWVEISTSVLDRVRATTRRTWPVDAHYPGQGGAESGDTLRISDHIIRTTISRAVAGVHGAEPLAVDLHLDGHTCTGAAITVTGAYGTDLHAVGTELADLGHRALTELLGNTVDRASVTVHIKDINHSQTY